MCFFFANSRESNTNQLGQQGAWGLEVLQLSRPRGGVGTAPVAGVPASFCLGEEIGEFVHSPWGPASPRGQRRADVRAHHTVCAVRGTAWLTHTHTHGPSPLPGQRDLRPLGGALL